MVVRCLLRQSRLSKTLRDEHGADWRSKLPLPTDHEAVMKVQRTGIPSIPVVAQQGSEKTAVKSTEVRASNEMNKEQQLKKYEELKEKGNTLVKKVCKVHICKYRLTHWYR